MNAQSNRGLWSDIKPTRLSKNDQNHCWAFALFIEFDSDRDDGRDYKAFLFRNDDRTIFGLKEDWAWQRIDYRKMATRVIQNEEFRKSLISSDPDLPIIWKRR